MLPSIALLDPNSALTLPRLAAPDPDEAFPIPVATAFPPVD
jgi:hypothetical protein